MSIHHPPNSAIRLIWLANKATDITFARVEIRILSLSLLSYPRVLSYSVPFTDGATELDHRWQLLSTAEPRCGIIPPPRKSTVAAPEFVIDFWTDLSCSCSLSLASLTFSSVQLPLDARHSRIWSRPVFHSAMLTTTRRQEAVDALVMDRISCASSLSGLVLRRRVSARVLPILWDFRS